MHNIKYKPRYNGIEINFKSQFTSCIRGKIEILIEIDRHFYCFDLFSIWSTNNIYILMQSQTIRIHICHIILDRKKGHWIVKRFIKRRICKWPFLLQFDLFFLCNLIYGSSLNVVFSFFRSFLLLLSYMHFTYCHCSVIKCCNHYWMTWEIQFRICVRPLKQSFFEIYKIRSMNHKQ